MISLTKIDEKSRISLENVVKTCFYDSFNGRNSSEEQNQVRICLLEIIHFDRCVTIMNKEIAEFLRQWECFYVPNIG